MFDSFSIVRFISIISYIGMIVSSITGFVEVSGLPGSEYKVCFICTSLVLLIQNLIYLTLELIRFYERYSFTMEKIYYIRGVVILQSSILAIGVSDVGLGFGILGVLIFVVNVLTGVFADNNLRVPSHGKDGYQINDNIE